MKIEKVEKQDRKTIHAKTKTKATDKPQSYQWWLAKSQKELCDQLMSTALYLKELQAFRVTQASLHARLYGSLPLTGVFGGASKMGQTQKINLPNNRPTMNVIQSCTDTLVSRITQSRPRPQYLTDNGNYKQRNLGKQLNHFIQGEMYRCKAHQLGEYILRDASVIGDGVIKVLEKDKRVALERRLAINLLTDPNDALFGEPRMLLEVMLVDREVLAEQFPEYKSNIAKAEQGYPDSSFESQQTVSDQVLVVEGWHLPSGENADDGRHTIVCSGGLILDEEWKKQTFPFVKLPFSTRLLGYWSQGLAEQLMGTQVEINQLLHTISKSINLVGVPRVFVEEGSKVVKAHFNNEVGGIVTFRGLKPSYEVAPCVAPELYGQLQRLVDYAYQQSGISALAASAKKPEGLNSGKAIREYDDLQSDRFAALDRRYHNFYIDLAYQMTEKAREIAIRDGKYSTVYPDKDGTREIDLPEFDITKNPFVIQCHDSSMLPRDPAGRKAAIVEDMQAGILSLEEGRRLLDYPDLEHEERLANAAQERVYKILDEIVEKGKYTPPDPFMPIDQGLKIVTAYINLYMAAGLEESKAQLLRQFFTQLQAMKQAAQPPAPVGPSPLAAPQAPPTSDMLPNAPRPNAG